MALVLSVSYTAAPNQSELFSRNGQQRPGRICSRELSSLLLTGDRMTLLSTKHPAQTQHWPALNRSIHPFTQGKHKLTLDFNSRAKAEVGEGGVGG